MRSQTPSEGFSKLDADGEWLKEEKGSYIREHSGNFLTGHSSPKLVESLVLREAIEFAYSLGYVTMCSLLERGHLQAVETTIRQSNLNVIEKTPL